MPPSPTNPGAPTHRKRAIRVRAGDTGSRGQYGSHCGSAAPLHAGQRGGCNERREESPRKDERGRGHESFPSAKYAATPKSWPPLWSTTTARSSRWKGSSSPRSAGTNPSSTCASHTTERSVGMPQTGNRVRFLYRGSLLDGTVFDDGKDEPHEIILGRHQVMKPLEAALSSMEVGEERTVGIQAKDAYGLYDERALQKLSRLQSAPRGGPSRRRDDRMDLAEERAAHPGEGREHREPGRHARLQPSPRRQGHRILGEAGRRRLTRPASPLVVCIPLCRPALAGTTRKREDAHEPLGAVSPSLNTPMSLRWDCRARSCTIAMRRCGRPFSQRSAARRWSAVPRTGTS